MGLVCVVNMKKTIKILIGDKPESSKVTLIYPEYKRLPSEYIPDVAKHIKELDHVVIRTCSESIVNLVGVGIDYKWFLPDDCSVEFEGKIYGYDSNGILTDGWPYGAISLYDFDDLENIFKDK